MDSQKRCEDVVHNVAMDVHVTKTQPYGKLGKYIEFSIKIKKNKNTADMC